MYGKYIGIQSYKRLNLEIAFQLISYPVDLKRYASLS
jgi:hypothetical protein